MQSQGKVKLSAKSRGILYHLKNCLKDKSMELHDMLTGDSSTIGPKEFHRLILKHDANLVLSEIDQLYEGLTMDSNGLLTVRNLRDSLETICEEDNPVFQLNIMSARAGKEHSVLIEFKDLLLQTDEYRQIIDLFITDKDGGYLSRQNVGQLLNNFDFYDQSKRQAIFDHLFEDRQKITSEDILKKLNLQNDALRINLSDFSLEESVILSGIALQEYQRQHGDRNSQLKVEESKLVNLLDASSLRSNISSDFKHDEVPNVLRPYFNYGSELDQDFAYLTIDLLTNNEVYIDYAGPAYSKGAGWAHTMDLLPDYNIFEVAHTIYNRQDRKGLGMLIEPKDITQGSMGNCYFLSAIAAIANRYPELVYRLFVLDRNPSHVFGVRLFVEGMWQTVPLDGYFPVDQKGKLCGAQPHYGEIWVMLLEKAWAKVWKTYDNIYSGFNEEGLVALTGAPTTIISSRDQDFLSKVEIELARGCIITCTTARQVSSLTDQQQRKLGVYAGHAYTLLDVHSNIEDSHSRVTILKIRNPWGKKGWKGDWSFESVKWTPKLRKLTSYHVDPRDGTFFISLNDFMKYFDHINISRVNLGFNNSWVIITDANREQFYQSRFTVEKKGDYYFTVYQQNRRRYQRSQMIYEKSKSWLFLARLEIAGSGSAQQQISCLTTLNCHSSYHRDNTIQASLEPGEYVIVSRVKWNYWQTHSYNLACYGYSKIEFREIETTTQVILNSIIHSFHEKTKQKGLGSLFTYDNSKITKRILLDSTKGIGFISITNNSELMMKTTVLLDQCKGISVLLPYKLPIEMTVLPGQTVICGFIVNPHGYSYKMKEKYRMFENQLKVQH